MENLNELYKLLRDIKDNATSIVNSSAILMNKILVDSKDVYSRFREKKKDLTDDDIDQYVALTITDYISDSRKVQSEIDRFVENLMNNTHDENMFLYQVWSGDVYDNSKIDALRDLNRDLAQQDERFTYDSIISKALELV